MSFNLSVGLESDPETIRAVRRMLGAALRDHGASEDDARRIEFVIGEALTNARTHAYRNGIGALTIDLALKTPDLTMTIHDHGAAVTLSEIPATLPADRRGRGLYTIAGLVDAVRIQRNDNGTGVSLTMTTRLGRD